MTGQEAETISPKNGIDGKFIGVFDLVFDSKNRMTVPAALRRILDESFGSNLLYLVDGGIVHAYPPSVYVPLLSEYFSRPRNDLSRLRLAAAVCSEIDQNGRVVLPATSLAGFHASLDSYYEKNDNDRRVVLIGNDDEMIITPKGMYVEKGIEEIAKLHI